MTLLDCINDPELFAPFFKGDTWKAWLVFLRALFAEPQRQTMIS